jgi:serine beta-lactamase-like protein LACTB, mitochondrial
MATGWHLWRPRVFASRLVTAGLVLWLATATARAQSPAHLPAATIASIEKAVTTEMSKQDIPGLSLAVVTDHELRWSDGYGLSDVENFVPAKASTVYRLGSISKPVTATAVMQLVERGKLDLDAPVQRYCPAFPNKPWPITSRELLGHLGGIRHYNEKEEGAEYTTHFDSVASGLSVFKDDPLIAEPGTQFHYSSFGYNLLGCVVEGASGQSFVDYIRQNIFIPAGMDHMQVDNVFALIPNRARGYMRDKDGNLHNSELMDSSYKIPSGGLCSTAVDLAKFAIAIETGKLLKPETLAEMFTSGKTRDGKETGYGFGWGIGKLNGTRVVAHGGGQSGVSTHLLLLPEKGIAVAAMCDLEGGNVSALTRDVAEILLGPTQRP